MSDTTTGRSAALDYHERTRHSEERLRRNHHYLDGPNQPLPFKIYHGLETVRLPRDTDVLEASTPPALEAVTLQGAGGSPKRSKQAVRSPDLATLTQLLYLSAGITKRKPVSGGEVYFRAHSNTGALYHIDLYVVCAGLEGLPAGVYQFGPQDLSLHRLRDGDYRSVLVEASGRHPRIVEAPVVLVSASTYWRNAWKYRERAYRHCYWDSGTLHANLLATASAREWDPEIVMGFADREVETLLGLDPQREGALTLVPLGWQPDSPPAAPAMPILEVTTEPLSPQEVDYPLIRETHAATALANGTEAADWRRALWTTSRPAVERSRGKDLIPLRPLSAEQAPERSLAQVIRKRGSTRAFDPERALDFAALSTVLDRATRGFAADYRAAPGDSLIDLYLIVHAVEELPSGAYYFNREQGALELLVQGSFRETAARLGLFQRLPGEAAVNVYALADLEAVTAQLGGRGYRAAQLEGGLTGGRMYLAAYAQRFGATGLTFLDDEVITFFSPHAAGKSVMFLTALGHSRRA